MLVLDRKPGSSVMIGEDIRLIVKQVKSDNMGEPVVVLCFDAPKHISIDRSEVRARRIENVEKAFNETN